MDCRTRPGLEHQTDVFIHQENSGTCRNFFVVQYVNLSIVFIKYSNLNKLTYNTLSNITVNILLLYHCVIQINKNQIVL